MSGLTPARTEYRPTGAAPPHVRLLLGTQLSLILAVVLPLLLLSRIDGFRTGPGIAATWVVIAYSGARLGMLAMNGAKRLLSLTFWVFVYVWLGLAPMLQIAADSFPLRGSYSTTMLLATAGVALLGVLARDVGNWWYRSSRGSFGMFDEWLLSRRLSLKRTVIVGVISVVIVLVLVDQLGGFQNLIASRMEVIERIVDRTGKAGVARLLIFATLLRVPIFVVSYLLLVVYLRIERSPRVLFLLLVFYTLCLLVNNPFNSARYWFGVIVLSFFYVVVPWKRSYSFALYALGTILLLLFLFPRMDLFRVTMDPDLGNIAQGNPLVEKVDYDAFQQLMNARQYVEIHGLSYGRQALGAVLFWVPRALWSSKPMQSGEMVAEASGYDYLNLSQPLWGEVYLDGGIIGVALAFVLYGFVTGKLEGLCEISETTPNRYFHLVVPLYAGFQILLLRGALMSAVAYLTPILGLLFLCTEPARRDDTGDGSGTVQAPTRPDR